MPIRVLSFENWQLEISPDTQRFFCRCSHCRKTFLEISISPRYRKWLPREDANRVPKETPERSIQLFCCGKKIIVPLASPPSLQRADTALAVRYREVVEDDLFKFDASIWKKVTTTPLPVSLTKREFWQRLEATKAAVRLPPNEAEREFRQELCTVDDAFQCLHQLDEEVGDLRNTTGAFCHTLLTRIEEECYDQPTSGSSPMGRRLYAAWRAAEEILTEFWEMKKNIDKKG